MASQWQRCEECRKIRQIVEFSDDSQTCQECRDRASRPRSSAQAAASRSAVRVTKVAAPTAPAAPANGTLTGVGVPGRGDREVRVRRARLRALEQLAAVHPEEFEELLAAARGDEGL
ncbi:MAG: hypothetical protein GXX79_12450 [Actinomycetales bacterium]|nr:hypothetical protein [Actinomycetales bacterium]